MKMKETFCSYADFNEDHAEKVNEEMEELKNELEKTRNIIRTQRIRYQQLISLFSVKLQEKEEETRNDLQIKHIQLTKILRALYVLEAKLRKEQRFLKSTLLERDNLIEMQQAKIAKLKKELEKISENRCNKCAQLDLKNTENKTQIVPDAKISDIKPDLISSIGIEMHTNSENSSVVADFPNKFENEENTYVISSLDDYDASLSSLHVRGTSADETPETFQSTDTVDVIENNQNASNENLRNRMIDEKLQNEMRKFKMKENDETFKLCSPRMILKEVTESPSEKLNGPVLKCVKQILSIDNESRKNKLVKITKSVDEPKLPSKISPVDGSIDNADFARKRQHPVKPPKPNFASTTQPCKKEPCKGTLAEASVSKAIHYENTLPTKLLPCTEKNVKFCTSNDTTFHDSPGVVESSNVCGNKAVIENESCERTDADESKIVQTVSILLSESVESEDEKCESSPTVSQMVKKFEGLKSNRKNIVSNTSKNDNTFQINFEEFHLVDKEIESTCEEVIKDDGAIRLEAEGEENNTSSVIIETTNNNSSTAKYETFLEVTGLSQKSILTPSRILSNHRNVVKPKDVKYRNRVKAAVIGEKCGNGTITSPTMKYWTEPYL